MIRRSESNLHISPTGFQWCRPHSPGPAVDSSPCTMSKEWPLPLIKPPTCARHVPRVIPRSDPFRGVLWHRELETAGAQSHALYRRKPNLSPALPGTTAHALHYPHPRPHGEGRGQNVTRPQEPPSPHDGPAVHPAGTSHWLANNQTSKHCFPASGISSCHRLISSCY